MSDEQTLLAHLWELVERHAVLDGLYEWAHDRMGFRAARTCRVCGVRSAKHACLAARHTYRCDLRAVEEALGITQLGMSAVPDDELLSDDFRETAEPDDELDRDRSDAASSAHAHGDESAQEMTDERSLDRDELERMQRDALVEALVDARGCVQVVWCDYNRGPSFAFVDPDEGDRTPEVGDRVLVGDADPSFLWRLAVVGQVVSLGVPVAGLVPVSVRVEREGDG